MCEVVDTLESAMGDTRSRFGVLIGLTAAAGAFGAAAMMSSVSAPTARADEFTDVINAAVSELGDGQTAFGVAATDFASSDVPGGLAAFFNGVDDDFLSAPDTLYAGTIEAITGENFDAESYYILTPPADFASALSSAESDFSLGESYYAAAPGYFEAGEYGGAAELDTSGFNDVFVLPLEQLLLGAAISS
jgi:hypothetical protein